MNREKNLMMFIQKFVSPALAVIQSGEGPAAAYLELTRKTEGGMRSHYVKIEPNCTNTIRFLIDAWVRKLCHTYFNLGYRARDLGPKIRGGAAEVIGIPGLWLDIDLASGVHAETALPSSVDEVMDLLQQALPGQGPTDLVHSGGGLHAYWLFSRPWFFKDETERREASLQLKGLHAMVQKAATNRGWKIDNVSDLPRMLRVPGSFNAKDPSTPKIVEFLPCN